MNIVILFCTFLLPFKLYAHDFPERGNTQIQLIFNEQQDFYLRLKAIKNAKKSIDIISFSQAIDSIGAPFLYELQKGLNEKCLEVRFIYDSFASLVDRDFFNSSARSLTSSHLKCKAKVFTLNIFDKMNKGLHIDDFIHEKALIIDKGTENEAIFVGGRGYTYFSSVVLDSALLITSIDKKKPALTNDIINSFEEIFNNASIISDPFNKKERFELKKSNFIEFKDQHVDLTIYRPTKIQLFSNDLFAQLLKNPTHENKREHLKNNNIDELILTIKNSSGEIQIASYSIAFPTKLELAIIDFLDRGNSVKLLTNGKESHQIYFPLGAPLYYSLESIERIQSSTKNKSGLNIYFLNPTKAKKFNHHGYLHQKFILINDLKTQIIYTGTDNYTWSATYKNDEWLIKIIDDQLFKDVATFLLNLEKDIFDKITPNQIAQFQLDKPLFYKLVRPFIKSNY